MLALVRMHSRMLEGVRGDFWQPTVPRARALPQDELAGPKPILAKLVQGFSFGQPTWNVANP